ncbi:TetR/AcrR family transcriptional regulator [Actinomadura scrupuli]|uniref:TetR/AcrR family transcriptional regulator n=1 Tax=Actinomadura scrupuli TaxID=559629 RepID=UPI003D968D55
MGTTREALVEAAAELMDAGGLEAVTLREVGRLAGVSHNAPYKHFADKETLLAAVAARELTERGSALAGLMAGRRPPGGAVRAALHGYVQWALARPVRFKLVYGPWSKGTPELGAAATATRGLFVEMVDGAQRDGLLPAGDPERLTALLLALAHGAVDLALAGHLSAEGKGRAGPADLVDDLFEYLRGGPTG